MITKDKATIAKLAAIAELRNLAVELRKEESQRPLPSIGYFGKLPALAKRQAN